MKVAINGFGRIGRLVLRHLINRENVEIVAINDLTDNYTLAHLLKYDSAHGHFKFEIKANENSIFVGRNAIQAFDETEPENLPWKELEVDVVLECTGRFRKPTDLQKHLDAGAKKVLLSAPAKGGDIKTIVLGVNDHELSKEDLIISNASCTTNCLAPMVKTLHEAFGIAEGFMTTVHAYTNDQHMQDSPHKDLRRARAAAHNIIPTTTGAAYALNKVYPKISGKIHGSAIRVPVIDGSLTELTCLLEQSPNIQNVQRIFLRAAETNLHNIMQFSDEPLVSTDIIGNPHSCIYDSLLTTVSNNLVKIVGWYDNEYGYAARLADLTVLLAS